MDNIGQLIVYAASNHIDTSASQSYLWCLSRLDMAKFVQRSIIARRTPVVTRMVLAQFKTHDCLPSGLTIYAALTHYRVCQMMTKVLRTTFVYIRRKSGNTYQVVVEWNGTRRYPESMEQNYWEGKMSDAYSNEQNNRMNDLLMNDREYWEEYQEEMREYWADENQIQSILSRT